MPGRELTDAISPWEWYRAVGSPQRVLAPMVDKVDGGIQQAVDSQAMLSQQLDRVAADLVEAEPAHRRPAGRAGELLLRGVEVVEQILLRLLALIGGEHLHQLPVAQPARLGVAVRVRDGELPRSGRRAGVATLSSRHHLR